MNGRNIEIKRLKRIRQFQGVTRTDGDWREGWLQNYHKHMMARIEIKRAEDRVSDLSIRFPVSDGTQNEDDESEFEVDGIGNVVD